MHALVRQIFFFWKTDVVIFPVIYARSPSPKICLLSVLRGETLLYRFFFLFFERICVAFLGEGRWLAVAVEVEAVNKYRQVGVLGRNIEQQSRAMFPSRGK